jgi:hypothetical protein
MMEWWMKKGRYKPMNLKQLGCVLEAAQVSTRERERKCSSVERERESDCE